MGEKKLSVARQERAALADLFDEVGPDHPTLSGHWTTRDLAAHLVIRESRPDAAVGILVPLLARYTERVRKKTARRPYPELVERIRSGPPPWSPFRIPLVDRAGNAAEYFVHHEDVRRAATGWEPREADAERYRTLLAVLRRMGRMLFRRSPVTVQVDPLSGTPITVRAVADARKVTIVGSPDELMMFGYGRDAHSRVEIEGDSEAVSALRGAKRSV